MSAALQICNHCLAFANYCTCTSGPRVQRHPSRCECSMCDLGRELYTGIVTTIDIDEENDNEQ